MCKGKQLWDSSCGGHPDPTFILLQWEEWFIISRPKIGFWVNTCHIVQSLRKSQAPILPVRDPPSSVGQLPYAITWQPETNLTLRSPPPHSACCAVGSLSIVIISQHLSYQASPPSSPGHPHLSVHSPTSPHILLYHWWHPTSENGSNYLVVGPFHFYF